MSLPLLNEHPKYDFMIPSLGKKARFRPYLVKEEKVLLSAFSAKDKREGIKAIADTIAACSMGEVDPKDLTLFDLQYLFSKIRSKSVGENVELNIPCQKCEEKNSTYVDVDSIEFENYSNAREQKLKLTDEISIEMKYPNYATILRNDKMFADSGNTAEETIQLAADVITTVLTPDSRIAMQDESKEDRIAFVESMTTEQFADVRKFIEAEPSLKFDIKFKCTKCGEDNHYVIRNFEDFF